LDRFSAVCLEECCSDAKRNRKTGTHKRLIYCK
jgi:hypothetical protein